MADLPKIDGYKILEALGHGSCGTVYRALVEGTGRECAVKVFATMAISRQFLSHSLATLFALPRHPNVIRFIGGDLNGRPFHVVTDYLPRSLASEVYDIETADAWEIVEQLTEGLAFLHRNGLAHCNLSLDNVRLAGDGSENGYSVRITDIGPGLVGGVHHLELAEHPFYLAPEQLRSPDDPGGGVGQRWDVYSFGVLAYRLIAGEFPRGAKGIREFIRLAETATGAGAQPVPSDFAALLEAEPEIVWPEEIVTLDGQRLSVLTRCLAIDPAERFADMRDVAEAFREVTRRREAEAIRKEGTARIGKLERALSRKRTVAAVFAVGLLAAALAAGVFYWRWQDARSAEATMQSTHAEALENRDRAVTRSEKAMAEAVVSRDIALAQLAAGEEAGDRLFAALLEMDPAHGGGARAFADGIAAAEDHFYGVLERGSDPETEARARENLGTIYLAQGRLPEALPLLAEAADTLAEQLGKSVPTSEDSGILARFARVVVRLASLAMAEGKPAEARRQVERCLAFDSGADGDTGDKRTRAALEMIRARASVMLGDTATAMASFRSVSGATETLANSGMATTADLLLGARAQTGLVSLQLRVFEGTQDAGAGAEGFGPAAQTAISAIEDLIELRRLAPGEPAVLRELGHAYTLAGSAVSANGLAADASVALTQAVQLLSTHVEREPEDVAALALLGQAYSETALLARDLHGAEKAAAYAAGAVDFLSAALNKHAKSTEEGMASGTLERAPTSLALVTALTRLAELKSELKDGEGAGSLRQRASTLLDQLENGAPDGNVQLHQDIAAAQGRLAEALGHAAESAGDETAARAHFQDAVEAWSLAGQGAGALPEAASGGERARDRLAGLSE